MSLAKVEGFVQFQKDTVNGGVVNVDKRSFEMYKTTKRVAMQKAVEQKSTQEAVSNLQGEINNIKDDLNDIKDILLKLLEKR